MKCGVITPSFILWLCSSTFFATSNSTTTTVHTAAVIENRHIGDAVAAGVARDQTSLTIRPPYYERRQPEPAQNEQENSKCRRQIAHVIILLNIRVRIPYAF